MTIHFIKDEFITAGELRSLGAKLPEHIPDIATIPRDAIHPQIEKIEYCEATGATTTSIGFTITEPFSWVEIVAEINNDTNKE